MRPHLERLEDRCTPSVDITFGGGPTIPHIAVTDIHADASAAAFTDAAMQVIVQQYLPLLSVYGIGNGTLQGSVNVAPLAGNPTDAQIRQQITAQIQAGLVPQPGPSQAYCYFLAPGQVIADSWGGDQISGYHDCFFLNGQPVYYEVIYDYQPSQITVIESHEIGETVTDPQPTTGWVDRTTGMETEDVYAWQQDFQMGGYNMNCASGPQGQLLQSPQPPLPPPQPPPNPLVELEELLDLAVEQYEELAFRCLALIDPRDFADIATAKQNELLNNPMLQTQLGQIALLEGELMFLSSL
jgi:hypothetical protein